MGYSTDFFGEVSVSPPLSLEEQNFLRKFNETRRMDRKQGPYFVGGRGDFGQDNDPDVHDYNCPPIGQPGLWCQWVPNEDGTALKWDEGEKFYDSAEWMMYLIEHFLKPDCLAKEALPFLQANHHVHGEIEAQGESHDDHWWLVVDDNKVSISDAVEQEVPRTAPRPVEWDPVGGKSHYWRFREEGKGS